jgi:hypothetical protein
MIAQQNVAPPPQMQMAQNQMGSLFGPYQNANGTTDASTKQWTAGTLFFQ